MFLLFFLVLNLTLTLLENKLRTAFLNYTGRVIFVWGKVNNQQTVSEENNIKSYNFVLSNQLQNLINSANLVVCRSGYSSIVDF